MHKAAEYRHCFLVGVNQCGTESLLVPILFSGAIEDAALPSSSSESNNTEEQGKLLWLKENREITETLEEYWAATYNSRQKELLDLKDENPLRTYMNTYPALHEPGGYALVS